MTLATVVASAVAAANSQTASLQVTVQHEAWIGYADDSARPAYAAPVPLPAMVQEGTGQVRLSTGETIKTQACISFLELPAANGASGRREPLDPRDRLTLPSGKTGPIVDNQGAALNPSTGLPFILSVWLK